VLRLFASQGLTFDEVLVCPHLPDAGCTCRKPQLGLVEPYLEAHAVDRARSAVIGDRETDIELARRLGVEGILIGPGEGQSWRDAAARLLRKLRTSTVRRVTKETAIEVEVALDVEAPIEVHTGLGFFDHMLEQIAKHGGFSLRLRCEGDLHIDEHHTVEDTALALGQALREALGDKRGIGRYGFILPMDEAEAVVSLDLAGRPYAVFEGTFGRDVVGQLPTELVPHFFRSLADTLGAALHVKVRGSNSHHMIESAFKGLGRALRMAFLRQGTDVPSSKGVL
jgi:imidazoleglycerol-phosphate dehydratase/histidinol-phosphatase